MSLTGTALPTMLPAVEAFARNAASCSLACLRFASTCASISFFFATRSSAFSFAWRVFEAEAPMKPVRGLADLFLHGDLFLDLVYGFCQG